MTPVTMPQGACCPVHRGARQIMFNGVVSGFDTGFQASALSDPLEVSWDGFDGTGKV
ncbi:hypothetical protein FHW94_003450 [Novosphingobium sp. SG720]|nr:hypothetical protein [Novosphingobium sp. SG720]